MKSSMNGNNSNSTIISSHCHATLASFFHDWFMFPQHRKVAFIEYQLMRGLAVPCNYVHVGHCKLFLTTTLCFISIYDSKVAVKRAPTDKRLGYRRVWEIVLGREAIGKA